MLLMSYLTQIKLETGNFKCQILNSYYSAHLANI